MQLMMSKQNLFTSSSVLSSEGALQVVKNLQSSKQVVVIADKNVCPQPWMEGLDVIPFSASESSKTREQKMRIEDLLLEKGSGSDLFLIAVGGGVTTDLVGFIAATFCRGVPWMAVPTTLVGMVDAAIGGKTGVNTPWGKNLIGALHLPQHIWIDPDFLGSLPQKEWANGLAEMIKYACIGSVQLLKQLEAGDPPEDLIQTCIQMKMDIVACDFKDGGCRRILNFGHTVGHALEHVTQYGFSHGEAVALGMRVEADLSCEMGFLSADALERLNALLDRYAFPSTLPCSEELLMQSMRVDKKSVRGEPRFVLLEALGSPVPFEGNYCTTVPKTLLKQVLQRWQ